MRYAFSEIIINPWKPVRQSGHIQQVHPVSKVHDDLHARIFALENEDMIWIHLSMDLIQIRIDFQDQLKEFYQKRNGKKTEVTVSCSHTHYAGDPKDEAYYAQLLEQTSKALSELEFNESDDLTVSYQHIPFDGLGKSRISHHEATVMLGLLKIYDHDRLVMTFVYYNSHPTILSADLTDFFSADWPGYVLSCLKQRYPDSFFSFFQGAAGDVSTRFTRKGQDYDAVMDLGNILLSKITELMSEESQKKELILSYEEETIPCENSFDDSIFDDIPDGLSERELQVISYGRISRQQLKDKTDELATQVTISRVGLGEIKLVFVPNEMFSDYLRYVDPDHSLLVCYSNGLAYYLTPFDKLIISYETLTDTFTKETKQKIAEVLQRYGKT